MAWSTSNISAAMVKNVFDPAQALSWGSDTIDVALYNNSITPNKNDTFANNSYNAGQWANTNEVSQSGQWAAGGVALATKTNTFGSGTQQLSAANTASGSAATLASRVRVPGVRLQPDREVGVLLELFRGRTVGHLRHFYGGLVGFRHPSVHDHVSRWMSPGVSFSPGWRASPSPLRGAAGVRPWRSRPAGRGHRCRSRS